MVEVPPLALEVTEHRAQRKRRLGCGRTTTAPFPKEASARGVSYGPRIKALSVYLMSYQLLPYERTSELLCDLFGEPAPGVGTLHWALGNCFERLKQTEEEIKEDLSGRPKLAKALWRYNAYSNRRSRAYWISLSGGAIWNHRDSSTCETPSTLCSCSIFSESMKPVTTPIPSIYCSTSMPASLGRVW